MLVRIRSITDNRHNIRNPYGPGANDMAIWANTLLKERVASLFQTQEGIRGHAIQIEQELNRLAHVEGRSGVEVAQAVKSAKFIKASINKAKEAAHHFELHWQY